MQRMESDKRNHGSLSGGRASDEKSREVDDDERGRSRPTSVLFLSWSNEMIIFSGCKG